MVMAFPRDWRIQNSPDRVLARNKSDDAIVELRGAGPAQGSPLDALRKVLRGNLGSEATQLSINGLQAAVTNTSVQGMPARVALIFLGKSAFLIGGQAKNAPALQRALTEINASINSFHAMSEAERKLAKPLLLRIINAPKDAKFSELAVNSPLGKNAVSLLRLLNGLYPNGEPVAGQPLKVIE
jgi:predicted Zn-dependent protease